MGIDQHEAMLLLGDESYADAEELLLSRVPSAKRRFQNICTQLRKLQDDVRKEFPDSEYYSASGTFHLLLGPSHTFNERAQTELVAITGRNCPGIGGGDW